MGFWWVGGYKDREGMGGFGATGGEGMGRVCTKLLKHLCHVIKLNGLLDRVNGMSNVEHQTLDNGGAQAISLL
ncbi:unnamed protein product [Prunus armeniaca]